jgi:hypothetical protein
MRVGLSGLQVARDKSQETGPSYRDDRTGGTLSPRSFSHSVGEGGPKGRMRAMTRSGGLAREPNPRDGPDRSCRQLVAYTFEVAMAYSPKC